MSEGDSTLITCVCDGNSDDQHAIFCDGPCQKWYHASCIGMSLELHDQLSNSDEKWFCKDCTSSGDN